MGDLGKTVLAAPLTLTVIALMAVSEPARAESLSPPRAQPDYDGRRPPEKTVGETALWVPRVILSPLYFTTEYLLRRPLTWLVGSTEKKLLGSIPKGSSSGEKSKYGILPSFWVDVGFRGSLGIYAYWDDAGMAGNHLRVHASTLGTEWQQGRLIDRIELDRESSTIELQASGTHRPDFVFHGLGPRTNEADRSRFGIDRYDFGAVFDSKWWRDSRLLVAAGIRGVKLRDDACCGDASIPRSVAAGIFPSPPGFDRGGYQIGYQSIRLTLDTRTTHDTETMPGSGFVLKVGGEQAFDLNHSRTNWVRYGATASGFLDLNHTGRMLALSVMTAFADPLGDDAIPFTEQVVLGGAADSMVGYRQGRLVDRSAFVATLKYMWPIWAGLDGTLQAAVGNVFGPQLRGLDPGLLRFSSAIGIETTGKSAGMIEVLFGVGSETFDERAKIDSFRFVLGLNNY